MRIKDGSPAQHNPMAYLWEAQNCNWYGTNIAPHAQTVRASYTVPSGRVGWILSTWGTIERHTAPTAVGLAHIAFLMDLNNNLDRLCLWDPNAYARIRGSTHLGIFVVEGSIFQVVTVDTSTGGAINYMLGFAILVADRRGAIWL